MTRVHFRGLSFAFPLLIACLVTAPVFAGPAQPPELFSTGSFTLNARSAILIDQITGRVLFERNADQPFVPASLAKLMSLHIVYEKLEERSIHRDDVVAITSNAWAGNQARILADGPGTRADRDRGGADEGDGGCLGE